MGVISGAGLALCLIPMMTMLPVLLMRGSQNALDHAVGMAAQKRARIENLWLERPGWVIPLCAGALRRRSHTIPKGPV